MSNDYALFIITVPNDFDSVTSATPDAIEPELAPIIQPSINTVSALMAAASIPLPTHLPSIPSMSVCGLMKSYLAERTDTEAVWMISENQKFYQITFCVNFGFVSDRTLQDLVHLGIGTRKDTRVFVLPTAVILQQQTNEKRESVLSLNSTTDMNHSHDSSPNHDETDIQPMASDPTFSNRIRKRINESNFKKSVRARLMVHQVVASIRASSAITFDFVLLICLASMLAAFGLLENSTVIIVASMLVSPLMNPIMGIVFGLSIRDHALWRRGLRNEIIGLIICISCGFILGFFTTVFETHWGSSSSFPTSEMKSRGDVKRLWVGVLIALPSGAGVALSVLGGNTGSLVGVAISASLLPPAVNGGLLFAYAFLGLVFPRAVAVQSSVFKANSNDSSSALHCAPYLRNDYLPMYTCTLANEAAILGCCSLLLTIVNILCIVVMALFILRIKEVAPLNHSNKEISDFFHHDVKVARDYNKTIHESDLNPTATLSRNQLAQSIVNQWKTFKATRTQNVQQTSENKVVDPSVTFDMEMRRRLFRLKTFAKEYDLDVFNKDDYDLISPESREKVRLLVNDLIDMCHETPAVFIDLYRLQPLDTQTSADGEHAAFYREILELLPSKWYQLFMAERQRRHLTAEPLALNRSNSMRSYPLEAYGNLQSSTRRTDQNPSIHFQRQSSVPESASVRQVAEEPIKGTRFRLVKQ